jgi:cyanate lyase
MQLPEYISSNSGVHAKVISDRLGHSDIRITMNTYGHVFQKADETAADTFDNILKLQPNFVPKSKITSNKALLYKGLHSYRFYNIDRKIL